MSFLNIYVLGLNQLLRLYREEFPGKNSKTLEYLLWLIESAEMADTTDED